MNHNMTPDQAPQPLIEGNQGFQQGEPLLSGVARETTAENVTTHMNHGLKEGD